MPAYPPWPDAGNMTSGWELRITGPSSTAAPTACAFRIEFETTHIYHNLANGQAAYRGPFNADQRWVFLAFTFDDAGVFTFPWQVKTSRLPSAAARSTSLMT